MVFLQNKKLFVWTIWNFIFFLEGLRLKIKSNIDLPTRFMRYWRDAACIVNEMKIFLFNKLYIFTFMIRNLYLGNHNSFHISLRIAKYFTQSMFLEFCFCFIQENSTADLRKYATFSWNTIFKWHTMLLKLSPLGSYLP